MLLLGPVMYCTRRYAGHCFWSNEGCWYPFFYQGNRPSHFQVCHCVLPPYLRWGELRNIPTQVWMRFVLSQVLWELLDYYIGLEFSYSFILDNSRWSQISIARIIAWNMVQCFSKLILMLVLGTILACTVHSVPRVFTPQMLICVPDYGFFDTSWHVILFLNSL